MSLAKNKWNTRDFARARARLCVRSRVLSIYLFSETETQKQPREKQGAECSQIFSRKLHNGQRITRATATIPKRHRAIGNERKSRRRDGMGFVARFEIDFRARSSVIFTHDPEGNAKNRPDAAGTGEQSYFIRKMPCFSQSFPAIE
jgi:hypothetical protein